MDNQNYSVSQHQYECLLAAGVKDAKEFNNIAALDGFLLQNKEWVFGHLCYELNHPLHGLNSKTDKTGFPLFYFYVPAVLITVRGNELTIFSDAPDSIFEELIGQKLPEANSSAITIHQSVSKEQYIDTIAKLQNHIHRGDCYEINYCIEFSAEGATIDSVSIFRKLMEVSPNPFSVLYKRNDSFLLCASPERFLSKRGSRIISQPIKGTIKREQHDADADLLQKENLRSSEKDRAENVMVVDLVRNDLTQICIPATVQVDELYKIYSYPQVHQMISTVSGELRDDVAFSEVLAATFPMGSMTGAPKHRVMQLIDEYEHSPRGIFSGSVGYFSPTGDFDFNVVIRSIMYNSAQHYLTYKVGSGITIYSDPEQEWEECLLKAAAIKKVLTN